MKPIVVNAAKEVSIENRGKFGRNNRLCCSLVLAKAAADGRATSIARQIGETRTIGPRDLKEAARGGEFRRVSGRKN